jgi:hypothetical protein
VDRVLEQQRITDRSFRLRLEWQINLKFNHLKNTYFYTHEGPCSLAAGHLLYRTLEWSSSVTTLAQLIHWSEIWQIRPVACRCAYQKRSLWLATKIVLFLLPYFWSVGQELLDRVIYLAYFQFLFDTLLLFGRTKIIVN